MQQIGNTLENKINNCNDHNLKQASDLLINCRYKHPSTVSPSSNQELNILSLNIGTLLTKVETLRENIDLYSKFDVLLLNETNCIKKTSIMVLLMLHYQVSLTQYFRILYAYVPLGKVVGWLYMSISMSVTMRMILFLLNHIMSQKILVENFNL